MKQMQIGKSGVFASEIALGTFAMSGGTAWSDTVNDINASVRLIHHAIEMGVNYFDSAPVYGTGRGEEILGKAIAGRRGDVILGTKCSLNWRNEDGRLEYTRDGRSVYRCFNPQSIRADLEDSLRRLGTDYIDVYISHRQPDPEDVPELMHTLMSLKKEGKIRAIGISNSTVAHLRKYLECGQVDLAQEQFNLLSRSRLDEFIPLCEQNSITFQTYRALEEGILTGNINPDFVPPAGDVRANIKWYKPENLPKVIRMFEKFAPLREKYNCSQAVLSLAWIRGQSDCINLLVGARRVSTLENTLTVGNVTLTSSELEFMRGCAVEAEK